MITNTMFSCFSWSLYLSSNCRKQKYTFIPWCIVQLQILPDGGCDLEWPNLCDNESDTRFRSHDEGSPINYPIITEKRALLSHDNALIYPIIMGKWALLSHDNTLMYPIIMRKRALSSHDDTVIYPVITEKRALLSCDNTLIYPVITGKRALLFLDNKIFILWSRGTKMKKDS